MLSRYTLISIALLLIWSCNSTEQQNARPDICKCTGEVLSLGDDSTFLIFPTAFTPNKDGLNDLFRPIFRGTGKPTSYAVSIFNKDKAEIYRLNSIDTGWNGFSPYSNNPLVNGSYAYKVSFRSTSGKSYSSCGCVELLFYTNLECLADEYKSFHFEDELNRYTGKVENPSKERFCNP